MVRRELPKYVELFSYPEVTRYTLPIPRERVEVFAADFLCQWSELGFGPFALIDRRTGDRLGQIGLNRLVAWPAAENVEVGFELRPSCWGQGLATEGARACVHFGFAEAGWVGSSV